MRADVREVAAALFAAGVPQAQVARLLGVSRSTATRWRRRWESGGRGGLAARPRGRRPRLPARRMTALDRALLRSPRASGYDLDRWSLASVAALIEKRTGVRYHRRHVGRLLRRLGWIVPPLGPTADRAILRRPIADPDGNALAILVAARPRP